MSVPGSLMPTGQLDMSNGDVEPKTPEVLTVKQCRKPLAGSSYAEFYNRVFLV